MGANTDMYCYVGSSPPTEVSPYKMNEACIIATCTANYNEFQIASLAGLRSKRLFNDDIQDSFSGLRLSRVSTHHKFFLNGSMGWNVVACLSIIRLLQWPI